MKRQASKPPDDVDPEQVWRAPDGQHYQVASVVNGRATLYRCTTAGRVLNARYQVHESVDRMQADWQIVRAG